MCFITFALTIHQYLSLIDICCLDSDKDVLRIRSVAKAKPPKKKSKKEQDDEDHAFLDDLIKYKDLTADSSDDDDDKFLSTPSKVKASTVSQVEIQRGLNKRNRSLLSVRIAGQHFGAGPFLRNRRNTNGIPGKYE